MADKKIITDELLKLQTEKVLQVIADNVYQEKEYLEQEIDDMFDATPQEISYYESLINPDVVSENRLWSSKTIDEKLASAILEANKYTDQASTRNLTTEIVSSTADVTKENVLYLILSDASTNTYEQYMLIGGTATALGSTQVDLSNIYNKSEIDTKLDVKANKSEVLSIDSVKTTTGSETNDTVYSSKLTKDELDKKVNVTDISTTIDKNSTDDTIPTSKAIYDTCVKDNNIKTYTTLEQIGLTLKITRNLLHSSRSLLYCSNNEKLSDDFTFISNTKVDPGIAFTIDSNCKYIGLSYYKKDAATGSPIDITIESFGANLSNKTIKIIPSGDLLGKNDISLTKEQANEALNRALGTYGIDYFS